MNVVTNDPDGEIKEVSLIMSSVHSAGSLLAKITLQLHVFSFVLLQLTVTTEINGEKMSAVIKGNRKKYIWSLFTKNTRPLNYPRKKEKGVSRSHLTRADIQL